MKFFTPAWHSGALDSVGPDTAFEDYRRHLAPLLPNLPPDVQTLASTNLHDGLLFHLVTNGDALQLSLRCGDLRVGYLDAVLDYFGVLPSADFTKTLEEIAPVTRRRAAKHNTRCSEALYAEIDVDGEWIIHRILFIAGNGYHELTVRFKDLALLTQGRRNRHNMDNDGIHTIDVKRFKIGRQKGGYTVQKEEEARP